MEPEVAGAIANSLETMAMEMSAQTAALQAIAEALIRLADADERREEDRWVPRRMEDKEDGDETRG